MCVGMAAEERVGVGGREEGGGGGQGRGWGWG